MVINTRLVRGQAGPGAGSWVALASAAAGDTVTTFKPRFQDMVQKDALASPGGSGSQFRKPLGNVVCGLALEVCKVYASAGAALAAVRAARESYRGVMFHIQVMESDGTAETQYYPNAMLDGSMEADVSGRSVTYKFNFSTDDVTATQPTT